MARGGSSGSTIITSTRLKTSHCSPLVQLAKIVHALKRFCKQVLRQICFEPMAAYGVKARLSSHACSGNGKDLAQKAGGHEA